MGGAVHLKMTSSKLVLLFSLCTTVPALPPPQPATSTDASVQSRTNGLINDVKEINLLLNIPTGCDIVYDGLIKQLEGCRSGSNHGDPRLPAACSSWTSPTSNRIAPTPLSSSRLSKPIPPLLRFPAMAHTARQVAS